MRAESYIADHIIDDVHDSVKEHVKDRLIYRQDKFLRDPGDIKKYFIGNEFGCIWVSLNATYDVIWDYEF